MAITRGFLPVGCCRFRISVCMRRLLQRVTANGAAMTIDVWEFVSESIS